MQPRSQIDSLWKSRKALECYSTGVSLHSHTSCSEESLQFVHAFLTMFPGARQIMQRYTDASKRKHSLTVDFRSANWRPPLLPRMAFDLEANQLNEHGLRPLVSLTDHDTIEAPMLLRTVPSARHIPVSVEWSVFFEGTELHIGVHNLPATEAEWWMRRLRACTVAGEKTWMSAEVLTLLRELSELPGVLLILNHPLWDLHKQGQALHNRTMQRLLELAGSSLHALELNGLRPAQENLDVKDLARVTGHLMISGGDRHGMEPNANVNLTCARTFREFVDEIRIDRRSHVLFLEQYSRNWQQRMLESTLHAVTDFPMFTEGWQRWDERAFHADVHGVMRPSKQLWAGGEAPLPLRMVIHLVRLGRSELFLRSFGMAFSTRERTISIAQ